MPDEPGSERSECFAPILFSSREADPVQTTDNLSQTAVSVVTQPFAKVRAVQTFNNNRMT